MRGKFAAIALTLALLNLFAPAAVASTYLGCRQPAGIGIEPTWHVLRNVAGRQYNYAQGTTTIKQLHSCAPDNGLEQRSLVMVANLEAGSCFMQIGYGAVDGTMYFWASIHNNGDAVLTNMTLDFWPFVGDTATFSIFKVTVSGVDKWELRVTSSQFGTYGYRLINRSGCAESMPKVWYGIETHNYADQFGGPSNPSLVALHDLGYRYVGRPAATTWLQGNTGSNFGFWANSPQTIPACWHPGVSQDSGTLYTRLYGYTDSSC